MYKMVRVSEEMSKWLDEMVKDTGKSKQDLVAEAIDMLYRKYFIEKGNRAYAEMKKDSKKWQEELEERALWDCTLLDGLENDKYEF